MDQVRTDYICPMHSSVRELGPGKCPHCGMDLVPAGTRYPFLRHMFGNPKHLVAMATLMAAVVAIVMMSIPKSGH